MIIPSNLIYNNLFYRDYMGARVGMVTGEQIRFRKSQNFFEHPLTILGVSLYIVQLRSYISLIISIE